MMWNPADIGILHVGIRENTANPELNGLETHPVIETAPGKTSDGVVGAKD